MLQMFRLTVCEELFDTKENCRQSAESMLRIGEDFPVEDCSQAVDGSSCCET